MIIKQLIKVRKRMLLYSMSIFIVLSFTYLIIAGILQINANKLKKSEVIKNEQRLINVEQSGLSYRIDRVISDVLYISDNFKFNDSDNYNFKNIKNEWKAFSDRRKIYDQIRYIDVEGNEKIRINYFENGSVAVKDDQLQNKKDEYYFKETIKLKKNQTYISRLDLNIENDKIEQPNKPMIRVTTPIFGNDDKLKGIIILNYYANNLIKQFEETGATSYGNMFLLDSNGNWIYNAENREKEWAFMYEDKKNINFKNEFPEEWDSIDKNKKGMLITPNGYYFYTNIIPNVENLGDGINLGNNSIILGEGNLIAVSFISKDNENKLMIFTDVYTNMMHILKNYKFIFLFISALSVSFAILMTINKLSKERIKYFSEYDSMTGTLNRRAGFELLNKIYQDFMKGNGKVSICYSDINGLKEINDNLGHETGDELILTIVNEFKKNISKSDFIIRLGGDEFLVIFINSNINQAEKVWEKINDEFERINKFENRKYILSASHGIEEFKFNSNEYIDEVISLADRKMYDEKKNIKKHFKAIRDK